MQDTVELPRGLRAYVEKTGVALSLAVIDDDGDVPLVLANQAFCTLTGYEEAEVVGRNCRFLQGPETTDEQKQSLHDFIHDHSVESGRFPVMNYRKDGSVFFNFVYMTRLRDRSGTARYILASQFDMTSALRQSRLRDNDKQLNRNLTDIEAIGREYGLAMMGSAKMLADSVATIARLTIDEDDT